MIGFGGYYVWHTNHHTSTSTNNNTQSNNNNANNTTGNLTMQDAINSTQTVYNSLKDNWSSEAESTVISSNSSLFTSSFIQSSTNSQSYQGMPLVCGGNGMTVPDSISYTGVSSDSTQAVVQVTFNWNGSSSSSQSWPVTLQAQNGKWLIDKVTCQT